MNVPSINQVRFEQFVKENAIFAAAGAFTGFIYSKLAAFPRNQLMIAFTVAASAEHALFCLVNGMTKDKAYRTIAKVVILTAVPKLGLDYLARHMILHPYMMQAIIVSHAFMVVYQIYNYFKDRPIASGFKKPERTFSEEDGLNGKTIR